MYTISACQGNVNTFRIKHDNEADKSWKKKISLARNI